MQRQELSYLLHSDIENNSFMVVGGGGVDLHTPHPHTKISLLKGLIDIHVCINIKTMHVKSITANRLLIEKFILPTY